VQLGVTSGITLSIAAAWLACQKPAAPPGILTPAEGLCRGRPRCSVADRLSASSSDAGSIVILRLGAPPDATEDEDHCDRREYWLSRPSGDVLLAVDCDAQWGADNTGPASLSLRGSLATFRYVEFLANDGCEIVEATLRLPQARIETHTRHWGEFAGNQCRSSREVAPVPEPGAGTANDPVLVLHRP
jgi:hypothetical protein